MESLNSEYAKKVSIILDGFINNDQFLTLLKNDATPNYKYTPDDIAMLFTIDEIVCEAIEKLNLKDKIIKSLKKISTVGINENDIIKMFQSKNIEGITKMVGGSKKHKRRKTEKRTNFEINHRKTKRQRGGDPDDHYPMLDRGTRADMFVGSAVFLGVTMKLKEYIPAIEPLMFFSVAVFTAVSIGCLYAQTGPAHGRTRDDERRDLLRLNPNAQNNRDSDFHH